MPYFNPTTKLISYKPQTNERNIPLEYREDEIRDMEYEKLKELIKTLVDKYTEWKQ